MPFFKKREQNFKEINTRVTDAERVKMPPKVEATIVIQKCPVNKGLLGVRIEKKPDKKWYCVWNFPISDARAQRENYSSQSVQGEVLIADEYKGCPYCGARYFVQCGQCHKLSCYKSTAECTCSWCDNHMTNITTGGLNLKGGDF